MPPSPARRLTLLEARVLGVLIEKASTVPDSYPLSLNSLTLGCNQKTARDPLTGATEDEVQDAVLGLKGLHLANEISGSRVTRFEHNAARGLALPSQAVALLATLALRGPQTVSELRANVERLHRFADASSVEGFLDELAGRSEEKGGPLAQRLPRAPGAREARWAHLLCGPVDVAALVAAERPGRALPADELTGLRARQDAMQAEIDELRELFESLRRPT